MITHQLYLWRTDNFKVLMFTVSISASYMNMYLNISHRIMPLVPVV